MISMKVYRECLAFREKTGRWPRADIRYKGRHLAKMDLEGLLDTKQITKRQFKELKLEMELANKWKVCPENKLLVSYRGISIEEIPSEYQEMISTLRSIGIGFLGRRRDVIKELEAFFKEHGRIPGKVYTEQARADKDKAEERRLYQYWATAPEKSIVEQYIDIPIEEVPDDYRDTVKRLRAIGIGIERKGTTNLEDYISFVRRERREPMHYTNPTEDQLEEHDIKQKWRVCKEKKTFDKYKGFLLAEIPEEHRELVKTLRDLWLEIDGPNVANEVVTFIKKYNREPRIKVFGGGRLGNVQTSEEVEEIKLAERWERSFEKQVIDRMVGVSLDDIPHGYKGIVKMLRSYDLGYPESFYTRRYIKFIRDTGFKPREAITKNGRILKKEELTDEEYMETILSGKWFRSDDRKIYLKYKGGTIDEETYELYKDMLEAIDEVYELDKESRAERSKQKKTAAKEKIKEKRAAASAEKKAKREAKKAVQEKQQEALRLQKQKEANKARKKKAIAKEREKAKQRAISAITKSEEQRIAKERREQQQAENMRLRIQERNEREAERAIEKEAAKVQARIDNTEFYIQVADLFIEFIKQNKRLPRFCIRDENGVDVKVADLNDEQKREKLLRQTWDESGFIERIEAYTGTLIELVPEEYREVIAKFRSEGFGLTSDEYAKFRATRPASQVLKCVRTARDIAANKRAKAKELEEAILEQLRARGKEQEDE